MTQYLIDLRSGKMRPCWTDMEVIGFLAYYLDAADTSPAEGQMAAGYQQSAGFTPISGNPNEWRIDGDKLASRKYPNDNPYDEVSRCEAADGSTVILYDCGWTVVVRGGEIVWVARLD